MLMCHNTAAHVMTCAHAQDAAQEVTGYCILLLMAPAAKRTTASTNAVALSCSHTWWATHCHRLANQPTTTQHSQIQQKNATAQLPRNPPVTEHTSSAKQAAATDSRATHPRQSSSGCAPDNSQKLWATFAPASFWLLNNVAPKEDPPCKKHKKERNKQGISQLKV